jgi:hypothetical protein
MHLSQIESLNKLNNKKNFYFKNEFIFSERFKICSGIGHLSKSLKLHL